MPLSFPEFEILFHALAYLHRNHKVSISLNSFAFCLCDHKPKTSLKLVNKQSLV